MLLVICIYIIVKEKLKFVMDIIESIINDIKLKKIMYLHTRYVIIMLLFPMFFLI